MIRTRSTIMRQIDDLQLGVEPPEWPAMREVVLRMPLVGGAPPSSAWVRGTELARVETRRRSGWSSLRLRRRWLRLGSLKLRPFSRLIRLWETTSSKRSRCFLGMKILVSIQGESVKKVKVQPNRNPNSLSLYLNGSSRWSSWRIKGAQGVCCCTCGRIEAEME